MLVKDRKFYKTLFSLTLTIALQNLIVFGVNLADSLMLGRYSQEALSGVSLVNQIQFLLQMIVIGVSAGTIIFSSRSWGSNDIPSIHKITNIGMKFCLIFTSVLFFAVLLTPRGVLNLLSNEKAVVDEGVKYLRIICFSYPVFAITNTLLSSLRSVETVKIGFYVSLSTLFINVICNYFLIFGNWIFPELGARGAAIATLFSRIVELIITVTYVRFKDNKINLRLKHFGKTDKDLLKIYLRKGIPLLLSNTMWGLSMTFHTAIVGHLGESTIAANSITSTVFQIASVVVYGCANASSVLVSKTIGENKTELIKPYTKTLQIIYVFIGIISSAVLFFLKDFIIDFYSITESAKELSLSFMGVVCITIIGTSYQMSSLTGIVAAGGDTTFIVKNDLIFQWLIVIPSAYICAFVLKLNPIIVFCCLKSDQILKCPVAFIKTNRYTWIKKLK